MEKYLTTSELARLFNLSRQTLHFYDRKGVFQPAYKNPENGYRMYSHNQISQLSFIIYLRTIGFSLDRIKELLGRGNVDFTMQQLKVQSDLLKEQYKEIFRIDTVIKRKLNFVKQKMENIDFEETKIELFNTEAFVEIGTEKVLYENEIFYYFPTIVFYRHEKDSAEYDKIFGAYVELDASKQEYIDQISYTKKEDGILCYHKGAYEDIMDTIRKVHKKYEGVKLSDDFICINIIDQFLENNSEKFITEIHIPILK